MKDITFIFPLFELNTKEKVERLNAAVKSLGKSAKNIIFVGSKEDLEAAPNKGDKLENTTEDFSYANQVMLAVKVVKTKYFSVIEQDDEANEKWFNYLNEYFKTDNDEIFAYLPLTEIVDNTDGETIGYANEPFWATSFSENVGFLDLPSMEDYVGFNVSGAVFKTSEFLALGGLKASMKLTFWYEFILRALYKMKKMFVVPRVGYYHKINVDDSLSSKYAASMSEKEAEWWLELAKKEYFFPQDRNKTYEEE